MKKEEFNLITASEFKVKFKANKQNFTLEEIIKEAKVKATNKDKKTTIEIEVIGDIPTQPGIYNFTFKTQHGDFVDVVGEFTNK